MDSNADSEVAFIELPSDECAESIPEPATRKRRNRFSYFESSQLLELVCRQWPEALRYYQLADQLERLTGVKRTAVQVSQHIRRVLKINYHRVYQ